MAAETFSWREVPFIRLLIPFIIGVSLAWLSAFNWIGYTFYVIFSALSLLLLFAVYRSLNFTANRIIGVAIMLWFIAFGYWRSASYNQHDDPQHFAQQITSDSIYTWYAEINRIAPKQNALSADVTILALADNLSTFQPCIGRMSLYIPPDSLALKLKIGSRIIFQGKANKIRSPLNPDAFDFAEYQAKKNVFHQSWVKKNDWQLYQQRITIQGIALEWRQYFMGILRQYLASGSNELAVAAALILGNKEELGEDLRNAYTNTGAVHVLAVSGLHVGFIAWGLGWLFSLGALGRPSWRWLRLILCLSGVWAFALITGLSPSVMRAATMFSFLLIGRTLSRKANIYNMLAASAFFLLLFNPFLLFNIGFQLSYSAVFGIVFFQPRIYRALYPPNKIIDYLWQMSSVAIAAQLVTLPLSLFYFHQFPVYFLLSGIVVVTAASFILGLGILLFISSMIPVVATGVGWVLSMVLWLNNAFIFALNKLPGGVIEGVWISIEIMSLLYVTIFFIMYFSYQKRTSALVLSLTFLALALGLNVYEKAQLGQQKHWVIYHQNKATVVDAFDGYSRYSFSSLNENDPSLKWAIAPHREKHAIRYEIVNKPIANNWLFQQHFIGFYDKKILLIAPDFDCKDEMVEADVILLQNTPRFSLKELSTCIHAPVWVIDGSTPYFLALRWMDEGEKLNISIHWTKEKGAFVLNF